MTLNHRLLHNIADDSPGGSAVLVDTAEELVIFHLCPHDLLFLVVVLFDTRLLRDFVYL